VPVSLCLTALLSDASRGWERPHGYDHRSQRPKQSPSPSRSGHGWIAWAAPWPQRQQVGWTTQSYGAPEKMEMAAAVGDVWLRLVVNQFPKDMQPGRCVCPNGKAALGLCCAF
jgi:hypothetical protein